MTPIVAIDISQAGGFGSTTLAAAEQGLPALGYVVSYRALQAALDAALARAGVRVRHGVGVTASAARRRVRRGRPRRRRREPVLARLAVGRRRHRRRVGGHRPAAPRLRPGRAGREGLARGAARRPSPTSASRRDGPIALLPEAITTDSSGRRRPSGRASCSRSTTPRSSRRSRAHFGTRAGGFTARRRPAQLSAGAGVRARAGGRPRCVALGNAAQTLHPVAGQGFNVGPARRLRAARRSSSTRRATAIGERAMLERYVARPPRRSLGGHRIHARPRARVFGSDLPLAALAARVGAHFARRGSAGEARVHARDAVRPALNAPSRRTPKNRAAIDRALMRAANYRAHGSRSRREETGIIRSPRCNSRPSLARTIVRIGPYAIANNLAVAPMAGVTDRPFRQLCKRLGAGYAVSEMVASNPRLLGHRTSRSGAPITPARSAPIAVQIAGADPAMMADAARYNVERGAQIIDINMGCPAKKVCNAAAGSALLRNEAAGRGDRRRRRARGRRAGHAQDPHRRPTRRTATRSRSRASPRTRASARSPCTAARAPAPSSAPSSTTRSAPSRRRWRFR